jgi:hypothetical protein
MNKRPWRKLDGVPIFLVDGSAIRKSVTKKQALAGTDNTMADFLDYGIHDTLRVHGGFRQVPPGEIWIADELVPEERDIVVKIALIRLRGLDEGKAPQEAYYESERLSKELRQGLSIPSIRLSNFREDDGVVTYIVNGFGVRSRFSSRFIQGGHGVVYDYIPRDEVWIDDTLDGDEHLPVFVHEFVERSLMAGGMKYEDAHEIATVREYECRETGEVPDLE